MLSAGTTLESWSKKKAEDEETKYINKIDVIKNLIKPIFDYISGISNRIDDRYITDLQGQLDLKIGEQDDASIVCDRILRIFKKKYGMSDSILLYDNTNIPLTQFITNKPLANNDYLIIYTDRLTSQDPITNNLIANKNNNRIALSNLTINGNDYEPKGTVQHYGGSTGGHYIYTDLSNKKIYNDGIVSNNIDLEDIYKTWTLVLYKKIQRPNPSPNPSPNPTLTKILPGQTYIQTKPDKKIFALSDIHSDIHSFIIVLRDLAQVIRKKNASFNNNAYDTDLERLLNIDICDNDGAYTEDLGYEWIPNNDSYIVIIGDMLDGHRPNGFGTKKDGSDDYEHQYPQIEIKLLRFINALNKQAMRNNGHIFKLFGNHEVTFNILKEVHDYMFPSDVKKPKYYRGKTRGTIFNYGNEGYRLLLEDGCRCLLMLNNYIFIHGQINGDKLTLFEEYNKILNTSSNKENIMNVYKQLDDTSEDPNLNYTTTIDSLKHKSGLWRRKYGSPVEINKRLNGSEPNFCNDVERDFENFLSGSNINYTPNTFKIVIGHCTQYDSTHYNLLNTTFTTVRDENTRQILSAPSKSGSVNVKENKDYIFGITMQCPNNDRNQHKIFGVDIGSSRGFDSVSDFNNINSHLDERELLFSRTPQVLKIENNNEQIIRSKMKNTRIHQPRNQYESKIKENPDLNLNNDHYKQKYLKYKQKYLELKQNGGFFKKLAAAAEAGDKLADKAAEKMAETKEKATQYAMEVKYGNSKAKCAAAIQKVYDEDMGRCNKMPKA